MTPYPFFHVVVLAAGDPAGVFVLLAAVATGWFSYLGIRAKLAAGRADKERDRLLLAQQADEAARARREADRAERVANEAAERAARQIAEVDAYHRQRDEEYKAVRAEAAAMRGRLSKVEDRTDEQDRVIEAQGGRIGELEASLEASQSQVAALQVELQAVTFERDTLAQQHHAAGAHREMLEGQLAEAKREARRLEALLKEAGIAVVATGPTEG